MAFAWRARLGTLVSLAGDHHGAAGFPCGGGRLRCTAVTEGDAASAPSVTHKPWAPATWLSGDDHGWTCTRSQPMTCKAHHAVVRCLSSPRLYEVRSETNNLAFC
jgi:hypothetical protein